MNVPACAQAAAVARFAAALQKTKPNGGNDASSAGAADAPVLEPRFDKFRRREGHTVNVVQMGARQGVRVRPGVVAGC